MFSLARKTKHNLNGFKGASEYNHGKRNFEFSNKFALETLNKYAINELKKIKIAQKYKVLLQLEKKSILLYYKDILCFILLRMIYGRYSKEERFYCCLNRS